MIASQVLLNFPNPNPNPNLPYDIKPDASNYQVGVIIKQASLSMIAFFSQKLTSSHHNYSTIKKELLSGTKTLKQCSSILKCMVIQIHNDQTNLTYRNL
jgi:hypothetical protein